MADADALQFRFLNGAQRNTRHGVEESAPPQNESAYAKVTHYIIYAGENLKRRQKQWQSKKRSE